MGKVGKVKKDKGQRKKVKRKCPASSHLSNFQLWAGNPHAGVLFIL